MVRPARQRLNTTVLLARLGLPFPEPARDRHSTCNLARNLSRFAHV
jgi:hypothetical protein